MKNHEMRKYINELARRGGLSHAWLLVGAPGAVREEVSLFLASAMLCGNTGSNVPCGTCADCRKAGKGIHPDLIRIKKLPEKKELLVDQVREMSKEAYILPNEAKRKVFIIEEADLLNISAQNAMLKLLEEPPLYASFILEASNPGSLFETVRSRCTELYIPAGDEHNKRQYSELSYELVNALAAGDGLALVKACAKAEKADKEAFDRLMDEMYAVSGALAIEAQSPDKRERFIKLSVLADRLREMRSYNVGAGHCLGLILSNL